MMTPMRILRGIRNRILQNKDVARIVASITGLPPTEFRPRSPADSLSDLFVWRNGEGWETEFVLFNQRTHMLPDREDIDQVEVILFSAAGRELSRHWFKLAAWERKELNIASLLPENSGAYGTLAIFHDSRDVPELFEARTHFTERGYIAYRRVGERVWKFMHGNLQAVAKKVPGRRIDFVAGWGGRPFAYRPQTLFDDCSRFELFYTNPSPREETVTVRLFDAGYGLVAEHHAAIAPAGCVVLGFDNSDGVINSIEGSGRLNMWRPAILKYSSRSYDIFHA